MSFFFFKKKKKKLDCHLTHFARFNDDLESYSLERHTVYLHEKLCSHSIESNFDDFENANKKIEIGQLNEIKKKKEMP